MTKAMKPLFIKAAVLSLLLISFLGSADVLNIQDTEELLAAKKHAELIESAGYGSDSLELYFSGQLTASEYDKALQLAALMEASILKFNEDTPEIDPVFFDAYRQLKPENALMVSMLVKAHQSPYYHQHRTSEKLIHIARVLKYGIPVQSGIKEATIEHWLANSALHYLGHWVGYYFAKDHQAKLLKAAYTASATPVMYNASGLLYLFSSSYSNNAIEEHTLLMESMKLSSDDQGLQGAVRKGAPLTPPLKKLSEGNSKRRLIPVTDSVDQKDTRATIAKVLEKAKELPGSMYLLLYRGKSKYQFFTLGCYEGQVNLTYVVDDNQPTPVLTFSMPEDQVDTEQLTFGIHAIMNGRPHKEKDAVPDLDSAWLLTSE